MLDSLCSRSCIVHFKKSRFYWRKCPRHNLLCPSVVQFYWGNVNYVAAILIVSWFLFKYSAEKHLIWLVHPKTEMVIRQTSKLYILYFRFIRTKQSETSMESGTEWKKNKILLIWLNTRNFVINKKGRDVMKSNWLNISIT